MYLDKESLVLKYVETRDPALRDKLVMTYKPLVEFVARKLAFNRNDFEDLVQIGVIGLLKSMDRYLPDKETDFSTFATPNIIGEIKHYFRDKGRLVRVPRKLHELHSRIKSVIREKQKDGVSPTIMEIATELAVTEELVLECLEANQSTRVMSLDSPASPSGDSRRFAGSGQTLMDSIGVENKEDQLLNKESIQQAMKHLDLRSKRIIYHRFYDGLSQLEIAGKIGISQMHVSRLLTKAMEKLKSVLDPLIE